MKIFRAIRLILWSFVLALCVAIVLLNYSLSQVTNSPVALQDIARRANTYAIIRDDILTPRILKEAQDAGYSDVIDTKVVQSAVGRSFDDATLSTLIGPATTAMSNWLSSKQPDPSFSIDARQQLNTLADALAAGMTTNLIAQPVCTYRNTSSDVATGKCQLPDLDEAATRTEIATSLKAQPTIKAGVITSEQVAVPDTIVSHARNIPEYLNMLNSAAIFAAGIAILSALWLLFKHRFRGIAVLGFGGLLGTALLYAGQTSVVTLVNSYALEPGYQSLVQALTQATVAQLNTTLLPLAGISLLLSFIGWSGWFFARRRHKQQTSTVHLPTHRDGE